MEPKHDVCGECRFIYEPKQNEHQCRRFPPTPMLVPARTLQGDGLAMNSFFPPIAPTQRACGEFLLKAASAGASPAVHAKH